MKRLFISISTATVLFLAMGVSAQTVTKRSYDQARPVLDKAVTAYGGLDDLRSIRNFTVKVEGELVHRNQSRRTGMSQRTAYNSELVMEVRTLRFYQLGKGSWPMGFYWHQGALSDGKNGAFFDNIRKTFNEAPNIQPAAFRSRARALPQMIVINALERASRLRYLSATTFNNAPHQVVSYANEDGLEISLYFDDKTGLLSKYETLGTDPFTGDTVTETIFTDYRNEGSRPVPTGRMIRVGGELTEEVKYTQVTFNSELTEDRFKPSADLKPNPQAPQAPPVNKLAENVYTVNTRGYNVLFVAFNDHIMVIESPGNDAASKFAIEQIKKTVPGKPIRYVVPTHHHDDHAGGLRTYVAEGATVVALPGEKAFFEQAAKSTFTIDPDALSLSPKPIKIETVEGGRRVFTDGTMTVEIIDIGPNPHTEAMHVAYLPKERILFQGDLINLPANGDFSIVNDTTRAFAKWVQEKKLPVDKIVGVHGPATTAEELQRAAAATAQASTPK